MLARRIIDIAKTKLNDEQGKRWPDAELLADLNDGQRRIVSLLPSTKAKTAVLPLVAGTVQQLPADTMSMLEALRNMGVNGSTVGLPVTMIDRRTLDQLHPGWSQDAADGEIIFVMYDKEQAPREFRVFPPQPATPHQLEVITIDYPTDCTLAELDGTPVVGGVDSAIDLPENAGDALLYFLMFRAHTKDSRYALQGRAERYWQKMLGELGLTYQREATEAQRVQDNSDETPTQ